MPAPIAETSGASAWRTIRRVSPYLWPPGEPGLRARVVLALVALLASKLATVATPAIFKAAVDALAPATPAAKVGFLVAAGPVALTLFYGVARLRGRGLRAAARRGLRPGRAAGAAAALARDLPARACAEPALPHRAQDRRAQPHPRARGQGRRLPAADPALVDLSADRRAGAGRRHPLLRLRRPLPDRRGGDDRGLFPVHLPADREAGRDPAADERPRHRGEPEGGRQPAELRDGEILQRRGARGRALRRLDEGLRAGRGRDGGEPELAQLRPDRDHHRRARGGDGDGGARRAGGQLYRRRLRDGQCLHDPDHHPARLPRRGLSRHAAGARRHGGDVRPAGAAGGDHRPARGEAAGGRAAGGSSSATSPSATSRSGRSCAGSTSSWSPGRRSPWSGRRGRGSRRSGGSSSASTT